MSFHVFRIRHNLLRRICEWNYHSLWWCKSTINKPYTSLRFDQVDNLGFPYEKIETVKTNNNEKGAWIWTGYGYCMLLVGKTRFEEHWAGQRGLPKIEWWEGSIENLTYSGKPKPDRSGTWFVWVASPSPEAAITLVGCRVCYRRRDSGDEHQWWQTEPRIGSIIIKQCFEWKER